MDEADLARRAVTRRVITEDQLNEARSFAEGGRSLLSVLMDLGYLRADQLPALMEIPAPPPPRPRRVRWVLALATSTLLAFFAGRCHEGLSTSSTLRHLASENLSLSNAIARKEGEIEALRLNSGNRKVAVFEHLRAQGLQMLSEAETRLKQEGRLSPEIRDRFLRGAALLDAAEAQGPLNHENYMALGRAREALVEWEPAYQAYLRALQADSSRTKAMLGAARAALELGKTDDALKHAQRAVALEPSGEAYLLRGRAAMQSGQKQSARRDFLNARTLDPSLAPAVSNLLDRLSRE